MRNSVKKLQYNKIRMELLTSNGEYNIVSNIHMITKRSSLLSIGMFDHECYIS